MIRKLFYKLPPKLRFAVRYAVFLPYDIIVSVFRPKGQLAPPKRLIFIGSGNFTEIGNLFKDEFVEHNILSPESNVLDVGCGIGRSAIPLTGYLKSGRYEGFDIIKTGINWCNKHIASRFPNFRFTLVDLSNDLYKNSGGLAQNFTFPYPDNSFDLVIVLSVFTHMVEEEVERYFSEISRVLKTGGHCYSTFFILNESSVSAMKSNSNAFDFKYDKGNYSLIDEEVRSANVAFNEDYLVNSLVPKNGFVVQSLMYGTWSKELNTNPIGFQDRLILQKKN